MNPEENEHEEQSSIPAPVVEREEPEDNGEVSDEQMQLDDLKNRATTLGIKFHPSIGMDKLREKVQSALEESAPVTTRAMADESDEEKLRAQQKSDALKLVRVRITCMDPMKKSHQGELFLTGNALVGTVKRFVPFGAEWHVPQIILNMIQDKKYQQFSTSKNSRNVDITTSKLVKTYGVEILTPLTEKEMKELGQRQAMKRGEATD